MTDAIVAVSKAITFSKINTSCGIHFQEATTDVVDDSIPTLEDLGVTLTHMEDQVPWELKPFRAHQYYIDKIGEFPKPENPKVQI